MPMIMDDDINVDDLFGEPASLGLGLPANISVKGLAQRLDEMRLLGCCQKIAWSKQGCIAYITPDSLRVNLRHLECRPSDGKWVLSDDTPLLPVTEAHTGHPIIHVCWNEVGSELAVVDSSGRVSIYNIAIALNSLGGLRQAAFDTDDDGAQIVGMMWLNVQRSVHAFNQAAKVQGRWAYSPFRRRPIPPFHPAGKAGLICITRSGIIRFLYQNPDGRWAEISAELKNTSYSDRLLTHAALVATPGGILVVTHSACQKICFYRVQINWTPAQWDPSQLKQAPAQFPTPSFRFMHSKVEVPCSIPMNRGASENSEGIAPSTNTLYSLTRLDIVLAAHDNSAGMASNPWIVGIFSIPSHATADHPQQQGPPSVIVRWQLESAPQLIHQKFDEVSSKKSNTQVKPKAVLRRLEDIFSDKYIVSVEQTEYGNVLALTYDDSSIAFYDPKTMAVFNGVNDSDTVTSLAQAGFHYTTELTGLNISFSPSGCNAVMLDSEGQVQLRCMEHSYGAESGLYDENKFSAAVSSLTLAFCRACGAEINSDDLLLILRRQLSPVLEAQSTFINEVYRALPINCNFTQENDKLMSHQYLPKCLSIQAALGYQNKYKPRSFSSNIPWAILQLRHASVLYALFLQYNKGGQTEPPDPEALRILLGNTKWTLDFLHCVLNALLNLSDDFESVSSDQEAFAQKLKSTNSLPLIIILSSMSRAFLRFICRGLRGMYAGYTAVPLVGDARVYYSEICQTLDTSPVRIDVYEKFVAGVDSAVRHVYQGAGFGDAERPGPERELLVNSRIPPVLVTAVTTILRQTIPVLKPEIDRMAIYMGDYSWLGLGTDRRTEMYRRTRTVDIVKKIPLRTLTPSAAGEDNHEGKQNSQGQLRRRCVRCCEVLCGAYPPRPLLSFRMMYKLG
ncbi:mediator complex subunit [Aspergillus nanangensis]|uniref:Mediator of RNA polymerase II transcription subunit 16 n=1 Tax=Aspergillus nanangensis TaxID=2582783 RepID=A0AAD4CMF3_ASPNN|nr:mediator complex subunit [Aspergillus nanangensis]